MTEEGALPCGGGRSARGRRRRGAGSGARWPSTSGPRAVWSLTWWWPPGGAPSRQPQKINRQSSSSARRLPCHRYLRESQKSSEVSRGGRAPQGPCGSQPLLRRAGIRAALFRGHRQHRRRDTADRARAPAGPVCPPPDQSPHSASGGNPNRAGMPQHPSGSQAPRAPTPAPRLSGILSPRGKVPREHRAARGRQLRGWPRRHTRLSRAAGDRSSLGRTRVTHRVTPSKTGPARASRDPLQEGDTVV